MKQSEIQEIITATPDAVFYSNKKYNGDFIITGFVKEARSSYASPTTYALVQRVYFKSAEGTTRIGERTETMPLRMVTGSLYDSVAEYTAGKVLSFQRTIAARKRKEKETELMTDLTKDLTEALKQAGVDNKAWNWSDSTTFKIEVDVDNAEQLLKVLRQFAQVNA